MDKNISMWLYKKNTKKALGDRLALDEGSRLMWASSVRHIYARHNYFLNFNFKYTEEALYRFFVI